MTEIFATTIDEEGTLCMSKHFLKKSHIKCLKKRSTMCKKLDIK